MLLTRIWGSILAVLATTFLAGMYLLSLGEVTGFGEADRAAVRAVTQAGLAALEAQIQSSPVQRAPALLTDTRLRAKLAGTDADTETTLAQVLIEVSEENLLKDYPKMTLGVLDGANKPLAISGIAERQLEEAAGKVEALALPSDEEAVFSANLGTRLHVVKLSRPDEQGRRLIAITPLETGADSLLRAVLGTQNPAALVRKGALVGELIGDQPVQPELEALATEHAAEAPEDGASPAFLVGGGLDARVGCLGRVPGPAGAGDDGTVLVVLSAVTAAASQRDVGGAISKAIADGQLPRLPWPVLGGLLLLTVGLAFMLPGIEALGPIGRLTAEFEAIAAGQQHQVFHDRYPGTLKRLAAAAAAAHDALRAAFAAELAATGGGEPAEGAAERPRTGRVRREPTRGHKRAAAAAAEPADDPGAIDLPAAEDDAATESHRHDAPAPAPRSSAAPPTPVPSLFDAEPDTSAADSLASAFDGPAAATGPVLAPPGVGAGPPAKPAAPAKPAGASRPAAPAPAPSLHDAPVLDDDADAISVGDALGGGDPKEAYFRQVFDEFVALKRRCGESLDGFTYEKFAKKLRANTHELKGRPGVADVEFSVYEKDGKAALKAKVVRA